MNIRSRLAACLVFLVLLGCALEQAARVEKDVVAWGGTESTVFGRELWSAMLAYNLVGPAMIRGTPYEGQQPHGAVVDVLDAPLTIRGNNGWVVVMRNYGPKGVRPETVAAAPASHLENLSVMYRRESGYDAANRDWFWAQYRPDGQFEVTGAERTPLVGRIAKGTDSGCIACHRGGDDNMLFTGRTPRRK